MYWGACVKSCEVVVAVVYCVLVCKVREVVVCVVHIKHYVHH